MKLTKKNSIIWFSFFCVVVLPTFAQNNQALIVLPSKNLSPPTNAVKLDNLFYETTAGRIALPAELTAKAKKPGQIETATKMPDGRTVKLSVKPNGSNFDLRLTADPSADIKKWGLAIDSNPDEYYTGLMERVVDGAQAASWKPGITEAMNLRGQTVEMILKPTTSVYAPFYLSSRGYAIFTLGDFPGFYDFAASDKTRVKIEFEGPQFNLKIYTANNPADLIKAHAADAGLPFLPPKWMFAPWRWRDEHTERAAYYDGTPVTAPFNSEVMEDVLMMRAYGIPNGVYWIDRPWGPGKLGYDDFEIDEKRLPNFAAMVKYLDQHNQKTVLWIGPFYQGKMMDEALARKYNLPGQEKPKSGNNYPLVDFTNPEAKAYWQTGLEKLLKLGVAGFKLDRAEEDIPETGETKVFDGRSIRENRNAYPLMYIKATYESAKKYRPNNDFVLMPRAAYTGSAPLAANWGGDIGGTQEGLRASIIAVERSAVMGYSNWGSDTCGYNQQLMEQETCGRWLEFSAFTPIMEVGPTKNVAFWNLPRAPEYDATLIALWRMYARVHEKLMEYGYKHATEANKTGMPIVRPLFLVDPKAEAAWTNWWTFQYGSDILVSPIWEKNKREQTVYLPSGQKWQNAWDGKIYPGGQTIKVAAELYQMPIFTRVNSKVNFGDLNKEWQEAQAIAHQKPDLNRLETEVKEWFDNFQKTGGGNVKR